MSPVHAFTTLGSGRSDQQEALSGALYALTPAMEEFIYDKELHVLASQASVPFSEQIQAE